MMSWGRVALGTVLPFMFTTYDGATGASEEGSGLGTADIEIYKAGGGLTQRSSDVGYALLDADGHALDSIVGLAGFTIDTGDNTDAGFFVAGGYYIVVVSSVTVDAVTVNFIAGTFSLGPTLTVAGVEEVDVTHWLGTAAATPTVAGVPEVDPTHWNGTAVSAPATAGIPEVNVKNAANVAWASGAITAAVIATDAIGAAELADGAITAATFAAGAIDAAAIANDAIDAAALASDVVTELSASILAVLGALNDAAADGAVTATDTMVAYLKQIINTLEGAPGIPTWPAAAAPGNAVSIAEALRYLYDQVGVAGTGLTAADDAVIAILGTPAGVSLAADIAAIEAQTDDIGAAGAGLTAVPWNAAWDAEVESEVTDALNAILSDSIPADGTLPTVRQSLYMLTQFMLERSVSGTTVTVKKADGSTSLFTLTIDDATNPTSITRAT